jgi:aryl-alcohol dehydrogenase-like predicted oxidoreductase
VDKLEASLRALRTDYIDIYQSQLQDPVDQSPRLRATIPAAVIAMIYLCCSGLII